MMKIIDCEQGTAEWFRARAGMPTASEFATVMAKGKGGGESLTRKTYLYKLAGELLIGEPAETYTNASMERGKVMEAEARDLYALVKDADLTRVGFVVNGAKGCSPDSLIGADGMLEIKTTLPHLLIALLLKDEFPPEHKAQTQGALWVAEREWIDIAVYWPKLPLFVKRATRDDAYIKTMAAAVDTFNNELAETVARLRAYGGPQPALAAPGVAAGPTTPPPNRERLKALLLSEIAAIASIKGLSYWTVNNAARLGLLAGADRAEVDKAIADRQDAINRDGSK